MPIPVALAALGQTEVVRSVFVFTDAPAELLRSILAVDWQDANRVIQDVHIEDPPEWVEWDNPFVLRLIRAQFGHLPRRMVMADISGRVVGSREALEFVGRIRALGATAVFDDWSEEPWSDDELRSGHTRAGRAFLQEHRPAATETDR